MEDVVSSRPPSWRPHARPALAAGALLAALSFAQACDFSESPPAEPPDQPAGGAGGLGQNVDDAGVANGGSPAAMGGAMAVDGGPVAGASGATGGVGGGDGGAAGAPVGGSGGGGQGGMQTGGSSASYPAGPYGFAVGNVVADLAFTDALGNPKRLSDLRSQPGVKVILWSSGAEWCSFCSLAAPKLQKLHETRKAEGLAVVESLHQASNGSQADAATLGRWSGRHSITYPLWVEQTPPHSGHTQNPDELIIDAKTMKIRFRQQHTTSDLDAQIDDALKKAGS